MHKPYPPPNPSRESGYTLLESIMAMVVVSVLMVAIAPVLGFAFSTRVQAKRVELASKAANSYINAVRSGRFDDHPEVMSVDSNDFPGDNVSAPTGGSLDCKASQLCTTPADLYCVDNDGDGACTTDSTTDMIVQGVGNNECSTERQDGYELSVRVYRADAFDDEDLENEANQSATGLGNPKAPLVSIKTAITTSDTTFNDFTQRLSGGCASTEEEEDGG